MSKQDNRINHQTRRTLALREMVNHPGFPYLLELAEEFAMAIEGSVLPDTADKGWRWILGGAVRRTMRLFLTQCHVISELPADKTEELIWKGETGQLQSTPTPEIKEG